MKLMESSIAIGRLRCRNSVRGPTHHSTYVARCSRTAPVTSTFLSVRFLNPPSFAQGRYRSLSRS